jgi:hypothetical protein
VNSNTRLDESRKIITINLFQALTEFEGVRVALLQYVDLIVSVLLLLLLLLRSINRFINYSFSIKICIHRQLYIYYKNEYYYYELYYAAHEL